MTCLFCNVITGDIPATILYEDEKVMVFDDIHPQAPCHKIIIPKKHIATLNELDENEDIGLLGSMLQTGTMMAAQLNIEKNGYRFVMNCNADGGQTVFHIHLHLLGGRQMTWPPG
jgi:histidine triad (HIT) family protein